MEDERERERERESGNSVLLLKLDGDDCIFIRMALALNNPETHIPLDKETKTEYQLIL